MVFLGTKITGKLQSRKTRPTVMTNSTLNQKQLLDLHMLKEALEVMKEDLHSTSLQLILLKSKFIKFKIKKYI